jgi:6-pyruvoyltetrahydropterin/6-carboxytetrahydropterin synthase
MHGHGFEVILHARTDRQPSLLQQARIDAAWQPLAEELHHSCLNDIPGLENPTSEMLALWLWQALGQSLEGLSWITVRETSNAGCHYDGQELRIWKEQEFESALTLSDQLDRQGRRRLHGHSYRIRLHLTAPLDQLYGWTVDYGDVKALFKPIYSAIDHHRLDQLAGMAGGEPSAANIARWIREKMAERLPQLDRIDLFETPNRGAMLDWHPQHPALPA